jgi:uncharacterized protein
MTATTATVPVAPATTASPRNTVVTWFEVPVADFDRAIQFYESIFDIQLTHDSRFPGLAIFPYERPGISGAILHTPNRIYDLATQESTVVYLNCDGQLDNVLARAISAGADIAEPKMKLPGNLGWTAMIRDLDGNRIGLHAAA